MKGRRTARQARQRCGTDLSGGCDGEFRCDRTARYCRQWAAVAAGECGQEKEGGEAFGIALVDI